jgi:hypothetical protein
MKKLIGVLLLLVSCGGCVIGGGHHGRSPVGIISGHSHCVGCGHVEVGGAWYIKD